MEKQDSVFFDVSISELSIWQQYWTPTFIKPLGKNDCSVDEIKSKANTEEVQDWNTECHGIAPHSPFKGIPGSAGA